MIKVAVIGFGNVASHLISAFQHSPEIEVVQAFSRDQKTSNSLFNGLEITNNLADLKQADVYIIAVSDAAIADISNKLTFENKFVVHTSGSVDLTAMNVKNRRGVFYPLQTFTKGKSIDFSNVPIFIETEFDEDKLLLKQLAQSISKSIHFIDSKQRKALHRAAVYVCNFVNHLYAIGDNICQENQLSFDLLLPLIAETASKVQTLTPKQAQTGPAKRHDQQTIATHLAAATTDNERVIYELLTKSIQDNE
jgi:predicted short-subunit dehydrogenase-like oxidoreductase (DUF2520 family)